MATKDAQVRDAMARKIAEKDEEIAELLQTIFVLVGYCDSKAGERIGMAKLAKYGIKP